MTVHEAPVGASVEWYTPVGLFVALGGPVFDLDPAAGWDGKECGLYNRVPARHKVTAVLDGLSKEWAGFDGLPKEWAGHVWLNPPYGRSGVAFIDRMIAHGDGLMLLPSRTETAVYQRALGAAWATCFLRDRLWFTRNDGVTGRSSFGSTLFAFGEWAARLLHQSDVGPTFGGLGHPDAGNRDRNHYDWFMPDNPTAAVNEYLDDFEAKLTEALTDPFVHDMAHSVLPLIAAYRAVCSAASQQRAVERKRAYRARARAG